MISRFFTGFAFVINGFQTFKKVPGLKRWVLLPFLIDIAIFVIGVIYGGQAIHNLVEQARMHFFTDVDSVWVTSLSWLVQILVFILFFIFHLYFTYVFASLIGAPFFSKLADKTLANLAFSKNETYRVQGGLKHNVKMLTTTLIRAVYLLGIGAGLFLVSFMPGLNFIAAYAAFILIAFDMSDYALELKGYQLGERFRFLGKNLPEYFGMGAFVGLTAFVPGLILLCVPFGVIGASLLIDKIDDKKSDGREEI